MSQDKIVEYLTNRIHDGRLYPGCKLPSTVTLGRQFHVHASVARAALYVLRKRGLIDARPGAGHFVISPQGPVILTGVGQSLQQQILDSLQDRIATGTYPLGTLLPSLRELAREYRMSVMPVRRAILHLNEEGVLKTEPRVGTFVIRMPQKSTGA